MKAKYRPAFHSHCYFYTLLRRTEAFVQCFFQNSCVRSCEFPLRDRDGVWQFRRDYWECGCRTEICFEGLNREISAVDRDDTGDGCALAQCATKFRGALACRRRLRFTGPVSLERMGRVRTHDLRSAMPARRVGVLARPIPIPSRSPTKWSHAPGP